jgi:type IV pilus assembly protein PilM
VLELFRKKKNTIMLGLDISSSTVKLLELGLDDKGYVVESYAVVQLPSNAVVEKNIQEVGVVGDVLQKALDRSKTKVKFAAVAVSGSAVITKIIEIDSGLSDSELEVEIEQEADQYIPYPLDEVAIDFAVLGQSERDEEQDQVLLAACRRENIEARTDALDIASLTPKVVDIEAYALQRIVEIVLPQLELDDEKIVAVVDVGNTTMTLSIFSEGETKYTREHSFGGSQLVEEIQRRFGLSQEEASSALRGGGLPEGYEEEVLNPFKDSVVQQITRALQFFFSSSAYNDVDYILLAGGVAVIPGLDDLVGEQLGSASSVLNPFENMKVAKDVDQQALENDAPAMAIACGLAMRSFS